MPVILLRQRQDKEVRPYPSREAPNGEFGVSGFYTYGSAILTPFCSQTSSLGVFISAIGDVYNPIMARVVAFGADNGNRDLDALESVDLEAISIVRGLSARGRSGRSGERRQRALPHP